MKLLKLCWNIILSIIILQGSFTNVFSQPKKGFPFIFITYNIRLNTPEDGINAWPNRKDKVISLLLFHKADIFVVQEALPEQMDDLINGFPDFDHVGVGRDDGKREGEHAAIFFRKSRFENVRDGMFWLSENPDKPGLGWDAACNRICTWIQLKDKITKNSFYVFNTHLDHRGHVAREEGAKLILKKISDINKNNLALILAGDFNLTKEAPAIQNILNVLIDSKDISKIPHYGPEGTNGSFEVGKINKTIDFIFINNKIDIHRHGTLSDSFGLYYPSDHLPVLAEISIK